MSKTIPVKVNTKEMLMCVLPAFEEFGIRYIEPDDFINGIKNTEESNNTNLLRLLFDLSLLHMFDYEIDLKQLQIEISQEDQITVILAHLVESECPLLVDLEEGKMKGFNFQKPRDNILAIGWVMAVSDFFGHIEEYILRKANKNQRQQTGETQQKINSKQYQKQISLGISSLCKSIRVLISNINNMKKKKIRLSERISHLLKENGINISVSQFINNDSSRVQKQNIKLKQLINFMLKQKSYMRFRNHFWVWMEKVVKKDKQQIADHPDFEFQEEQDQMIQKLRYNSTSLGNFIEEMESSEALIEEYLPIFEEIEDLFKAKQVKITQAQRKQLASLSKILPIQLNRLLPNYYDGYNPVSANSFIGIQLFQTFYKNQTNVLQEKTQSQSYQKVVDLCKANIENLSALKFI